MSSKTKWLLITIIVQFILVALIFQDVLIHPNNYFFEAGNEAIKNYLIPAFYIRYDTGVHFSGMNYPYGELPIFIDCQFPIAWCLQFIEHHFFPVAQYVPGIFNLMMLLSFLPCAAYIYLILSDFQVRHWFAMISAIGITMLSPQVIRMEGHFSLSYLFYIPMILYFTTHLLQAERKWKWVVLITVFNLVFGLIHLYYPAIMISFELSFLLIYGWQNYLQKKTFIKNTLLLLFSSILPFLIIEAFIFFIDPAHDRIKYPWGFFFAHASFNSTYLPPLNNILNFAHLSNGYWEGFAYVGVVGWAASLLILIKLIRKLIGKSRHFLIIPQFLRWSLYASFIVFLFSCAFPFKWGMESVLQYLGPLRQFRAVGRFAWVYYYILSITGVYCLHQFTRLFSFKMRSSLSGVILVMMIAGWSIDIYFNFTTLKNQYKPYPIAKDFTESGAIGSILKRENKKAEDFQAILTLPFFHVGSEKFWLEGGRSLWHGLKVSFETGLPMVDSYMGRTSLSNTLSSIQLVADRKIKKEILDDWPSEKPLLLLVTKDNLTPNEKYIVSRSRLLFESDDEALYELPVETFAAPFDSLRNHFFSVRDSFFSVGKNCYTDAPGSKVYKKKFSPDTGTAFFSDAPFQDSGTVKLLAASIDGNPQMYEASVWIKLFTDTYEIPILVYSQQDETGTVVDKQVIDLKTDPDNYKGWVRASCYFELKKQGNMVNLHVQGKYLEADRFLLRPANVNIYDEVKKDSSFVLNNYFIPPPYHSLQ